MKHLGAKIEFGKNSRRACIAAMFAVLVASAYYPWRTRRALASELARVQSLQKETQSALEAQQVARRMSGRDHRLLALLDTPLGTAGFVRDAELRTRGLQLQQFSMRFPTGATPAAGAGQASGATASSAGSAEIPQGWSSRPVECQMIGGYSDLTRLFRRLTSTPSVVSLSRLEITRLGGAKKQGAARGVSLNIKLNATLYTPGTRP